MKKSNFEFQISKFPSGQVMLLSVLIMGGVMAAAMAVSLVMLNEIRLARQTPLSVKALAAADSGVECALYQYLVVGSRPCGAVICDSIMDPMQDPRTNFSATLTCGAATSSRSIGISGDIRRSLEVRIPF